jgi:RNA polymerase subunit RPABC4/transcription elongation factor Spt4
VAEAKACIRCGTGYEKGQRYCSFCGAPVVNRCTDPGDLLGDPCGNVCKEDQAFCPKCGSITAFNKAGLLHSPYRENKALYVDELAEMNWFSHPFFQEEG